MPIYVPIASMYARGAVKIKDSTGVLRKSKAEKLIGEAQSWVKQTLSRLPLIILDPVWSIRT